MSADQVRPFGNSAERLRPPRAGLRLASPRSLPADPTEKTLAKRDRPVPRFTRQLSCTQLRNQSCPTPPTKPARNAAAATPKTRVGFATARTPIHRPRIPARSAVADARRSRTVIATVPTRKNPDPRSRRHPPVPPRPLNPKAREAFGFFCAPRQRRAALRQRKRSPLQRLQKQGPQR